MDTILNLAMCSVSGEENGRHTLIARISHLKKRVTRLYYMCLLSQEKGDARYGDVSLFYFTT
jgi:hypothetical protein